MSDTTKKTDEIGPSLLPANKAKTETATRTHYAKLFGIIVCVFAPIIALTMNAVAVKFFLSTESKELMERKIEFLCQYELHFLYMAVYLIYLTRLPMIIFANAARAPTRLHRPDQHIYQVVGSKDLVLMANDGANGRFNRAQRAIGNTDESIPVFLATTMLVAPIYGQVVCGCLIPIYVYGRIQFASGYMTNLNGRRHGLAFSALAEHTMSAFVGLIAIKAVFGDAFPVLI